MRPRWTRWISTQVWQGSVILAAILAWLAGFLEAKKTAAAPMTGDTLTLVAIFDHKPDEAVWRGLQAELATASLPGGWKIQLVEHTSNATRSEFFDFVVLRMKGGCFPREKQTRAWRRQPLGWVPRVDGEFLSIVFIDCDRVAEAVSRVAAGIDRDARLAAGLSKVIQHELTHLLLGTPRHDETGDFKATLAASELVGKYPLR
jgi:hypothetical protein